MKSPNLDKLSKSELIRALKFYANPENWIREEQNFGNHRLPSIVMLDNGHIAREALKAIGEEA